MEAPRVIPEDLDMEWTLEFVRQRLLALGDQQWQHYRTRLPQFSPAQRSQVEQCVTSLVEAVLRRIQECPLPAEPAARACLLRAVCSVFDWRRDRDGESRCPGRPV